MNFSQLHERLRFELQRRIERGSLTAADLARKAGMHPPHISNFLRGKRRLSLPALDRVMAALELELRDLLQETASAPQHPHLSVPIVSHDVAIHEDWIRPSAILDRVLVPPSVLANARTDRTARKPTRERFVAVSVTAEQAASMEPVLQPQAIVIVDRHTVAPTLSEPSPGHVYAVAIAGRLSFSYLAFDRGVLVLRPALLSVPLQFVTLAPPAHPSQFITGRVCTVINPL